MEPEIPFSYLSEPDSFSGDDEIHPFDDLQADPLFNNHIEIESPFPDLLRSNNNNNNASLSHFPASPFSPANQLLSAPSNPASPSNTFLLPNQASSSTNSSYFQVHQFNAFSCPNRPPVNHQQQLPQHSSSSFPQQTNSSSLLPNPTFNGLANPISTNNNFPPSQFRPNFASFHSLPPTANQPVSLFHGNQPANSLIFVNHFNQFPQPEASNQLGRFTDHKGYLLNKMSHDELPLTMQEGNNDKLNASIGFCWKKENGLLLKLPGVKPKKPFRRGWFQFSFSDPPRFTVNDHQCFCSVANHLCKYPEVDATFEQDLYLYVEFKCSPPSKEPSTFFDYLSRCPRVKTNINGLRSVGLAFYRIVEPASNPPEVICDWAPLLMRNTWRNMYGEYQYDAKAKYTVQYT